VKFTNKIIYFPTPHAPTPLSRPIEKSPAKKNNSINVLGYIRYNYNAELNSSAPCIIPGLIPSTILLVAYRYFPPRPLLGPWCPFSHSFCSYLFIFLRRLERLPTTCAAKYEEKGKVQNPKRNRRPTNLRTARGGPKDRPIFTPPTENES
jgi:hypothetical protein